MTSAIVDGLLKTDVPRTARKSPDGDASDCAEESPQNGEPSLREPAVGNPISHGQIVDLWRRLNKGHQSSHGLEQLLRGSRVYCPPSPPKPEPVRIPCQTELMLPEVSNLKFGTSLKNTRP